MEKLLPDVTAFARKLTWHISKESSHATLKNRKIQNYLDWKGLKQTEQDRIFNEFVLSGQSLYILTLEQLSKGISGEFGTWLKDLSLEFDHDYRNLLKELGVASQFTKLWDMALKQRLDEYRNDLPKALEAFPDMADEFPWFSIVSTGAIHHIRRGKTFPEDPLFRLVIEWIKDRSKYLIHEVKKLK